MEEFRQMIQERLTKVEEIQTCLKLSVVSLISRFHTSTLNRLLAPVAL